MFAIDESPINIPGVAAAVVTKRYVAQGLDELSLDVGNMISVIDMPPKEESVWWRGKKEFEVCIYSMRYAETRLTTCDLDFRFVRIQGGLFPLRVCRDHQVQSSVLQRLQGGHCKGESIRLEK